MSAALLLLYAFAAIALVGGLGVVFARQVVRSALALVVALLAVAGVYGLLYADFLALVQVLLYAGAVAILLLFALMLTRAREMPALLDNPRRPLAAIVALAFFGLSVYAIYATDWPQPAALELRRVPFADLGSSLFTHWVVPFEVASLVLLVALIGGIVIARTEAEEDE